MSVDDRTTTEADAARFARAGSDYDARDERPSLSDLRAEAEDDLWRAKQYAAHGRPTLAQSVTALQEIARRGAS